MLGGSRRQKSRDDEYESTGPSVRVVIPRILLPSAQPLLSGRTCVRCFNAQAISGRSSSGSNVQTKQPQRPVSARPQLTVGRCCETA